MKPFSVLIIILWFGISFCVCENRKEELEESTEVLLETEREFNGNETDNNNKNMTENIFTTYFSNFEVTKLQMQVRNVIKNFELYRAEIILGAVVVVASVFAISLILSGVYFGHLKKSQRKLRDLEKKKTSIAFPRDADMEVNAVLSIYRAKKIEIQAVNNGKASTHRYDEGTDDDEVIYEYAGKSKIIDFEVVNPVYFVDGASGYQGKLEEKQKY